MFIIKKNPIMKEYNKPYLFSNLTRYEYEANVVTLDDKSGKNEIVYDEVKEWCCDNCTDKWSHEMIINSTIMLPQENSLNLPLNKKLEALAYGEYITHMKLTFKSEQDATLFKLTYG